MTSPKITNAPRGFPDKKLEYLVPTLSEEVKKDSYNGIYEIKKPTASSYKFDYDKSKPVDAIQLRCQSLYTKRPDEVHKCNSLIKTIIGHGTGDQTELIECGRCRTSYLVRTIYDDKGHLEIRVDVWDLGRNLKKYAELKRDKNYKVWVQFHSEK